MLQLKKIVHASHSDDVFLQLIKDFENDNKIKSFGILAKIQELVPLTKSVILIKRIITAYTRRLLSLLEQKSVLGDPNLSQEVLQNVKTFWSIISSQQSLIFSSQMYGGWNGALIEAATSLASIYIDLFITAHGTKENKPVWSRRLYSLLNFDLPVRSIKVALLEVTGHHRDGVAVVGPVVREILQRKFDYASNPEYLLQFLLFKKWQHLADVAPLESLCRSLTAPPQFISWLKTYWECADDYIPNDKSLKGLMVSQFLLDLPDDDVYESLTDALQIAIFPEESDKNSAHVDVFSDTPIFVVDKAGKDSFEAEDLGSDKQAKRSKRKWSLSNGLDYEEDIPISPKQDIEFTLSPKRKKRKTESRETKDDDSKTKLTGFILDRGHTKEIITTDETVEIEDNGSEEEGDISDVLTSSENDDKESQHINDRLKEREGDKVESKKIGESYHEAIESNESDFKSKKSRGDEEEIESDAIEEVDLSQNTNTVSEILKRRNILVSDPVASSYFCNDNDNMKTGNEVQIIRSESEDSVQEICKPKDENEVSSPLKSGTKIESKGNTGSSPQKSVSVTIRNSPRKSPAKLDSAIKNESNNIKQQPGSPKDNDDEDHFSDSNRRDANTSQPTYSVFNVTVQDNPKSNVPIKTVFDLDMEENIATKLSEIRKSTSSPPKSLRMTELDSPTRRSTRLRVTSNKTEDPVSRSPGDSSLKDWLRSKVETKEVVKSPERTPKKTSLKGMTSIKDRHLPDEEQSLNDSKTKQDVFPTPPFKTYSRRSQKLSEKMFKENSSAESSHKSKAAAKETIDVSSDLDKESDSTEQFLRNRKIAKRVNDSTPSISKMSERKAASSKKLESDMQSVNIGNEHQEQTIAQKTPSKRKSITQKTPKTDDSTIVNEFRTSPSPGSRRRKSLRLSTKLPQTEN